MASSVGEEILGGLAMEDYAPPRDEGTPSEFRPGSDQLIPLGSREGDEPLVDFGQLPQDTTLADVHPRIDTPLRIDPPMSMKAPSRVTTISRDEQIRQTAFSPAAFTHRLTDLSKAFGGKPSCQLAGQSEKLPQKMEAQGTLITSIKDYSMLAFSAQRAGKPQVEGGAYFAMAVLYDNLGKFNKAIEHYHRFLELCQASQDQIGMALAYNCLGVDYMTMACPIREGSTFESGKPLSDQAKQRLDAAARMHQEHLNVADEGGQFVALSNLGLVAGELREYHQAAQYHQEALKIAINLQSTHAQSIAVGNLGLLAARQGDAATAEACLAQHLQLTRELSDKSSEMEALMQLGELRKRAQEYDEATQLYTQAMNLAEAQGEVGRLKRISCIIGVIVGEQNLSQYMDALKQRATRRGPLLGQDE